MEELIIARYIKKLKERWSGSISDPELINKLFDAITLPTDIFNKVGEPFGISKDKASRIISREAGGNIPEALIRILKFVIENDNSIASVKKRKIRIHEKCK